MVKTHVGCSINQFLCDGLNINPRYVSERISTIFLDSKPVDDIDAAVIRDGSTLALSGAMPGLVGAVMRRGSFYASFRDSISHKNESGTVGPEEGKIHLKLFNLVMKELGPGFLEKGIFVKSSDILGFLADNRDDFLRGCREVLLNGEPAAPALLKNHPLITKHFWTHIFLK